MNPRRRDLLCAGAFLLFSFLCFGQKTTVTVAGGYAGEGKPANLTALAEPTYATVDVHGVIYVSDTKNCRVRKIDASGLITTFAGTGLCGFTGDGGPATKAQLSLPRGIVTDAQANVYVADTGNERVRKIDASGNITTIAGSATSGFCGDGGPALYGCLNFPEALAIGNTNAGRVLFVADTLNNRIRQVTLDAAATISTVAGNGVKGFGGDGGPALDASLSSASGVAYYGPSQTLFISDTWNSRIRAVDMSTGVIRTFFGDSVCGGGSTGLCFSYGVKTDSSGNLYVADQGGSRIVFIDAKSGSGTDIVGNTMFGWEGDGVPANQAFLYAPLDVALMSDGTVLTVDSQNNRVRKGSGTQLISTIAGGYVGDGKPGTQAALNWPVNTALDRAGNLYIAEVSNFRVRKLDVHGVISTFAGNGYSGDTGDGGPATKASLGCPEGLAVDSKDNVYIADNCNDAIRVVSSDGIIKSFAQGYPLSPQSLAIDAADNLYAADLGCVVRKYTPQGKGTIVAGTKSKCGYTGDGIPATQAELNQPYGVAVDSAGNVYVGDTANHRVRKIDSNGIITTVAGTGVAGFSGDGGPATLAELDYPQAVAVDTSGNLYIADLLNARIRKINVLGTIRTTAGTGLPGFNGDNRPPLATNLQPYGVTISPAGALYVSTVDSYRVLKIQ